MQTIQLQVKDNYMQNVVGMLESIKDVMLDKIEIKQDSKLQIDPYFYERREQLHQVRDDIRNGKMKMYEKDEFEKEMDEFEKELILKYGN